jgi:hypothetical protein
MALRAGSPLSRPERSLSMLVKLVLFDLRYEFPRFTLVSLPFRIECRPT